MEIITRLTEEAEQLKAERDESDTLLQRVAEKAEQLHASNAQLNKEVDQLRRERGEMEARIQHLETNTRELEDVHNQLCEDFAEVQSVVQTMSSTKAQIAKNLDDCESILSRSSSTQSGFASAETEETTDMRAREDKNNADPPNGSVEAVQTHPLTHSFTAEDIALSKKLALRVRELQSELKEKNEYTCILQSKLEDATKCLHQATVQLQEKNVALQGLDTTQGNILDLLVTTSSVLDRVGGAVSGGCDSNQVDVATQNDSSPQGRSEWESRLTELEGEMEALRVENSHLEKLRKASNANSHRLALEKKALQNALVEAQKQRQQFYESQEVDSTGPTEQRRCGSSSNNMEEGKYAHTAPVPHKRGRVRKAVGGASDTSRPTSAHMRSTSRGRRPQSSSQSSRSAVILHGPMTKKKALASVKKGHAQYGAGDRVNFMRMTSRPVSKSKTSPWWVLSKE